MIDVVIVEVDGPEWVMVEVDGPESVVVEAGVPGPPGLSAYQLAVARGFAGDIEAWLASLAAPGAEDVDLVTIYNLAK
jgi:hypothetical protein